MPKLVTAFLMLAFLGPLTKAQACIAERRILGFSPDGRYFAYEQFGAPKKASNENAMTSLNMTARTPDYAAPP